jgi:putative PIN family toxin of toxin-antitoxin system
MRICVDTNVLVRFFGTQSPFAALKLAVFTGTVELAVSNDILLEYEEVMVRLSGTRRWQQLSALLERVNLLFGNIVQVNPQYRFNVIAIDPDDNKFVDCAIAAEADFIVTSDRDFAALRDSGYKPKPISPEEFIERHLVPNLPTAESQAPREKKRPPQ